MPTKYDALEVVERARLAFEMFAEYVEDHQAVQENEDLKKAAEMASDGLYQFYNKSAMYFIFNGDKKRSKKRRRKRKSK